MTQNVYDDPEFFAGYSRLPRSVAGLDGAPEWTTLCAMLPDMRGLRVVDLGCGFGWFCRWAANGGAADVTGLDLSERMLARAMALTEGPSVRYLRSDLEQLALSEAAYDVCYSSLALHYVADCDRLMRTVAAALKPGGRFVFSVEHPIYTASVRPGWRIDEAGQRFWPVDNYQNQGKRTTNWLADGVVKQHRTVGAYVDALLAAGLTLRRLVEWCPTDQQIVETPALAAERERPMFLLMAATR